MNTLKVVKLFSIVAFFAWISAGASFGSRPVRNAVLKPNQRVEATNKTGKVIISYVSELKRNYQWEGRSKTVKLIARDEPFLGKEGLYEPASAFFTFGSRLVLEESVINFNTEDEMDAFLHEGSAIFDWVYNDSGLVVGYAKAPSRKQINLSLFQLLIKGVKPKKIKKSRPNQIKLFENMTD